MVWTGCNGQYWKDEVQLAKGRQDDRGSGAAARPGEAGTLQLGKERVEVYSVMKAVDQMNRELLFPTSPNARTRGHR